MCIRDQFGLQRHPADRAASGSDLTDLRMHGAGVDRALRDVGVLRRCVRLIEVSLRSGGERSLAAGRAEMVGDAPEVEAMLAGCGIDGHAADRVYDAGSARSVMIMVVRVSAPAAPALLDRRFRTGGDRL